MTAADEPGVGATSSRMEEIASGLRSSRTSTFEAAVRAAVELGAEGDRLLAGLDGLRGWRPVVVVAALGEVDGPHGGAVLRRAIASRGRGTSDLRCAALLALAKREKASASAELSEAVGDADAAVRDYAVMSLAAVGDGRAWYAVLARLTATLGRTRKTEAGDDLSPVVLAVVYLLRHVGEDDGQAEAVVSLLRRRWSRLTDRERRWFGQHWPAVVPGSSGAGEPALPDPAALQRWLLDDPLFAGPVLV
ncbi:hypothetical protein JKP75_02600 [Blastococcus sp. TML/M2B]|uniref:hypothetical protein n=1 Tax=Blastococcus sp. TML/M2B TaxID=2798727 RepID=UPI00190CBC1F|nr:hypothetical protein [Blastococcus sp. TML/M2B]MBN1091563.1 hypothetical protein [Blastococcus sp. TML/M2B]